MAFSFLLPEVLTLSLAASAVPSPNLHQSTPGPWATFHSLCAQLFCNRGIKDVSRTLYTLWSLYWVSNGICSTASLEIKEMVSQAEGAGCSPCSKTWHITLTINPSLDLLNMRCALFPTPLPTSVCSPLSATFTPVCTECLGVQHITDLHCLCKYWLQNQCHLRVKCNIGKTSHAMGGEVLSSWTAAALKVATAGQGWRAKAPFLRSSLPMPSLLPPQN